MFIEHIRRKSEEREVLLLLLALRFRLLYQTLVDIRIGIMKKIGIQRRLIFVVFFSSQSFCFCFRLLILTSVIVMEFQHFEQTNLKSQFQSVFFYIIIKHKSRWCWSTFSRLIPSIERAICWYTRWMIQTNAITEINKTTYFSAIRFFRSIQLIIFFNTAKAKEIFFYSTFDS